MIAEFGRSGGASSGCRGAYSVRRNNGWVFAVDTGRPPSARVKVPAVGGWNFPCSTVLYGGQAKEEKLFARTASTSYVW